MVYVKDNSVLVPHEFEGIRLAQELAKKLVSDAEVLRDAIRCPSRPANLKDSKSIRSKTDDAAAVSARRTAHSEMWARVKPIYEKARTDR